MTSYPGEAAPRKNTTLKWLAVACFVVGLSLTGFFVWRIVETAPTRPQPIESGVVHLEEEGLTIYSSEPVLRPPCEAKDSSGADVPLERPTGSERISINDDTWYVVARSANPVPPGDYSISCTDDETGTTYSAGPRSNVAGFALSILGAIGSFLVFFGLGAILLGVAIVKNRRRNRPGNTFPTQPPGGPGGQPSPGAPGNYPPPGNTFPNSPGPKGS